MDDAYLFRQFSRDFAGLANRRPIVLRLTALQAWALLSQLQLALRHPANIGPTAETARRIAEGLEAIVATTSALQEVARRGWDPAFDGAAVSDLPNLAKGG